MAKKQPRRWVSVLWFAGLMAGMWLVAWAWHLVPFNAWYFFPACWTSGMIGAAWMCFCGAKIVNEELG